MPDELHADEADISSSHTFKIQTYLVTVMIDSLLAELKKKTIKGV